VNPLDLVQGLPATEREAQATPAENLTGIPIGPRNVIDTTIALLFAMTLMIAMNGTIDWIRMIEDESGLVGHLMKKGTIISLLFQLNINSYLFWDRYYDGPPPPSRYESRGPPPPMPVRVGPYDDYPPPSMLLPPRGAAMPDPYYRGGPGAGGRGEPVVYERREYASGYASHRSPDQVYAGKEELNGAAR
jgi:hypothetical protein